MRKQEFLDNLRKKLKGFPSQDIEDRLNFYSEMIDDRMDEGYTEDEAVSQIEIGSVNEITEQILAERPSGKIAKEKNKQKKKLGTGVIVLLAIGSPIWISLMIAAFAIVLSLFASLWVVILSLWAVFGAFIGCSFSGMFTGILFICSGNGLTGIALIGASLICIGLTIFWFFSCKTATKIMAFLTKKTAIGIKKSFMKKENAK